MSGLWNDPAVPKTGWVCEDVYDSCEDEAGGELHRTCEMCTTQAIRFVHVMRHRTHEGPLEVGCVCAGNMEGSKAQAKEREAAAKKRSTFHQRSGWRQTRKGNSMLRMDGFRLLVCRRGIHYQAAGFYNGPHLEEIGMWDPADYPTEAAARRATFNLIAKLEAGRAPLCASGPEVVARWAMKPGGF